MSARMYSLDATTTPFKGANGGVVNSPIPSSVTMATSVEHIKTRGVDNRSFYDAI